jgi:hypothetical protein
VTLKPFMTFRPLGLIFTAVLVCTATTGCSVIAHRVDRRRQAEALRVAGDLKQHRRHSAYFRKSATITEVGHGVSVLTLAKPWQVSYYHWPLGPWSVLNIETGAWTFEE